MRSTDEVYGSLAYDSASLLRVPVCVSRAFLVTIRCRTVAMDRLSKYELYRSRQC